MNNPLVVCALKDEFSIKGSNYNLLYTGVGKVNAAIHLTEYLLKKGRPEYIINYGTAGSKKVKAGSLVDCTKFVQRDMDVSGLGFEKNMKLLLRMTYRRKLIFQLLKIIL